MTWSTTNIPVGDPNNGNAITVDTSGPTPAYLQADSYGSSAPAYDPYAAQRAAQQAATNRYYDQQAALLQNQLGTLDTQRAVGQGNIDNSYNTSFNRLNQQKAIAERDYGIGVGDQEQGYGSARNAVASNVRARQNALQRLLGIAGSGNSSAAFDAVPLATAREGTAQLAPVQTTYYQNRRNLDNNWNDTLMNYGNSQEDLNNQRAGQRNQLESSIAQSRADILSRLSGIDQQRGVAPNQSYTDQIMSLVNQIAGLGGQYNGTVALRNDLKFEAPDLAKYALGPQTPISQQTPQNQGVDPTLLPVLAKKEDQLLANLG